MYVNLSQVNTRAKSVAHEKKDFHLISAGDVGGTSTHFEPLTVRKEYECLSSSQSCAVKIRCDEPKRRNGKTKQGNKQSETMKRKDKAK